MCSGKHSIFWADIQINAFAYAVMHGLWRSATEKSGCAFFWLQQEPVAKVETAYNNKVEKSQPAPQLEYCTEGTPREILMCYLERRQAQPDTYSQLKRMNNESK